jgi:hypothetical protein
MRPQLSPAAERLLAAALGLIALIVVVAFFEQLPIEGTSLAIDWKQLYTGLHNGPNYGNQTGLRIAPWSVLVVLPLGWLSFRASWGVLTFLTLAVEIVSVPAASPRWRQWAGVLLLASSFPSLRHIVDGNFEGLIIAGTLLLVQGLARRNLWMSAAGVLLATAKMQETWLLMLTAGLYVVRTWPIREWLKLAGLLLAVMLPCLLWKGPEWLGAMAAIGERGSIMDASLLAALGRAGLPGWVIGAMWALLLAGTVWLCLRTPPQLSREKAALLIAASLLLAPYSAGNSYLTVLAVGVVPLLLARPALGLALFALTNALFFVPRDWMIAYSAYYAAALLALTWALLGWQVWNADRVR